MYTLCKTKDVFPQSNICTLKRETSFSEPQFGTPELIEKSTCSRLNESERNKMVDTDESTCFLLPVGSCDACFDEYKIKFPFDLSSTVFGGNIRRVGIKVVDIPCSKLKVFAGKSIENNRVLYNMCTVNDNAADWCEGICINNFSDKTRITVSVQNLSLLSDTAKLCEIVFL